MTQQYAEPRYPPAPTLGDFPAIHGFLNMQKRMGWGAAATGIILTPIIYVAADALMPGVGPWTMVYSIGASLAGGALLQLLASRTKARIEKSLAQLSRPASIKASEPFGPYFASRTHCPAATERVLGELGTTLLESKLDVAKGRDHISGHGWRDGTVEANLYEANPGTMVDLLWLGLGASDAGRPEGLLARLASAR